MNWPIILLGTATGFATAVWMLLAWSTWRRHWLPTAAYVLLIAANLLSTGALFIRLQGSTFRFPPTVSTVILLILIVIPALLHLVPWLKTRKILGR